MIRLKPFRLCKGCKIRTLRAWNKSGYCTACYSNSENRKRWQRSYALKRYYLNKKKDKK